MSPDFMTSAAKRTVTLASAALLVLAASLSAHSATLTDVYSGGTNTYNAPGDVIGSSAFNITSADITRSGPGNGTLNVVIHTNYAGVPGTSPAEGTGYGSLFFSTTGWSPTGPAGVSPNLYPQDKYTANDWNYAFTMPATPGSGSKPATASALYAIGGSALAHNFGSSSVPDYYTTANGKITMSNVGGNPITYPHSGAPGFYFREGQAVQYTPNAPGVTAAGGTWEVNALAHTITFTILDNGLLGNSFALAWAMTCANDVIQGEVVLHGGQDFPTPLPAAVWLFGTVIAGGAGFGRWRKAKKTRALAA